MEGLTNPAIQRLSRVAGVKSMGKTAYDEVRNYIEYNLEEILYDALVFKDLSSRKTITADDVLLAIEKGKVNMAYSDRHKDIVKVCRS